MNAATQAPQRSALDTAQALDFTQWWQRAAELVELPAEDAPGEMSLAGVGLALLLKRLQALPRPCRALLLAMACLANPTQAQWLQAEVGLHVGQLTAADLGPEVFQVLVGLLATFHTNPSN
ncbi:hypothetical protein [Stutzerimonas nitrititolerans]|uniref:hypothetical protein n=1 Tax=Stutzerimonas nitrititolerans TaxID=2482751 RepID=UPI0028AA8D96|nr:hypothetical protein [Stutzerimonas nitrititolerans]